MSKGSAFARVIGMTKSLSPLSFDRSRRDGDIDADEISTGQPANIADDSPALRPTQIAAVPDFIRHKDEADDMLSAVEEAVKEQEHPDPSSAVVMPFPAVAKVTVVEGSASPVAPQTAAAPTGPHAEISGDMIEAIETDMASLLASLNHLDDAAPAEAEAASLSSDDWHEAEDDSAEEHTLALLSELDRMWQADPEVAGSRF